MEVFLGLIVLASALFLYFLPFAIALLRSRPNTGAIFVLNLLLGWSLVGWVVALVWAVSGSESERPAVSAAAAGPPGRIERKCPHCAEMILAEARICKHCRQPV